MKALIDGDVILYQIGFTTEDSPVEIAHIRADEFITGIILDTHATDYQIYLSDGKDGNFRYKVYPDYKSHRVQPKPLHYDAIKEHLITRHSAKIAYGMEADDAMSINLDEDSVICTIDKDLNQVEGNHFTWEIVRKNVVVRPKRLYYVSPDEGMRYFWKQMLIGDKADYIQGIDGIGTVTADKIIDNLPNERAIYQVVKAKYQEQWGDEWEIEMDKNGKLLWMLRHEEDSWELSAQETRFRETEQT